MTEREALAATDFSPASYQATLFTPAEELSTVKLLSTLIPRWVGRFDAEPIVLPQAEGMPREIPRLILGSASGAWRCEIASARINLYWRLTKVSEPTTTLAAFFGDVTTLLNEYLEILRPRVGRLAAVINRFARHRAPGVFLARHFCRDQWLSAPLNRPESFELHAHKRFTMDNFLAVNSWVRSKTGIIEDDPIVLVEQDINTPQEDAEARSFSTDEATRFFRAVVPEFDHILRLYYPTGATGAAS